MGVEVQVEESDVQQGDSKEDETQGVEQHKEHFRPTTAE